MLITLVTTERSNAECQGQYLQVQHMPQTIDTMR